MLLSLNYNYSFLIQTMNTFFVNNKNLSENQSTSSENKGKLTNNVTSKIQSSKQISGEFCEFQIIVSDLKPTKC